MISFLGLLQVSCNVLSTWFSVFISPYDIFVQGKGKKKKEEKSGIINFAENTGKSRQVTGD